MHNLFDLKLKCLDLQQRNVRFGSYRWCWRQKLWIMSPYEPKFGLKINVGQCDLYFMFQWFCIISWILFDVLTTYFGIVAFMGQYDLTFDLKINAGHCGLYFMVQWFLSYIFKNIWWGNVIFSDNKTVWSKLWPQSKYRSTWLSDFA